MNELRQPPLLRTKLHRPQYDTDVVVRSQLLARLDAGLLSPLVLVSAPAGFGKSTLLSAWLQQCPMRSTWLSLDADDDDFDVFLAYLIAAVRASWSRKRVPKQRRWLVCRCLPPLPSWRTNLSMISTS